MDRHAKERLVGASLLVALIVVVVPELLSGPKPTSAPAIPAEAVRTYTVDLADRGKHTAGAPFAAAPGTATAAPASATAAPANPAAPAGSPPALVAPNGGVTGSAGIPLNPAPSRNDAPAGAAPAAPPITPTPGVDSAPSPPKSAVTRPASPGSGGWAVQLGSFASEDNAAKLAHQLKVQGYPVYVLSSGSGALLRHRVRLGPLADRDAAQHEAAKLKAQGRAATLVPP